MNRLRTHTPFYLTRPAQVVYIIAAAVVVALLTGCDSVESGDPKNPTADPFVYRDRATGCEYLTPTSNRGITPRMGRDGKQICKYPLSPPLFPRSGEFIK